MRCLSVTDLTTVLRLIFISFFPFSIPVTVEITLCFNFTAAFQLGIPLSDLSQRLLPYKYNIDTKKVNNAFISRQSWTFGGPHSDNPCAYICARIILMLGRVTLELTLHVNI